MAGFLAEAFDWLKNAREPKELTLEGRPYTTEAVNPVYEPEAKYITISTLTGLVDYVQGGDGFVVPSDIHIRVKSPSEVFLESRIRGPFRQRETLMAVIAELPNINIIDNWMDQETMTTQLQACFEVGKGDFGAVAASVMNVTAIAEDTYVDNGVTQAVTFKIGAADKTTVALPNPVTLFPRRTFTEVDQPEGRFVFRMKCGREDVPVFKLVEADGGAWRNKAILSVADYLRDKLPEVLVIS